MEIDIVIENNTCITSFSSLECYENDGFHHYFQGKKPEKFDKILEFVKNNNGVTLVENENEYLVYNDPFKTIPLYVSKNKDGRVHLSSNFKSSENNITKERDWDLAGLWEVIIYGSSLWTRTIYKNVLKLPSASCVSFHKTKNEVKIEKYWNFSVDEDRSLDSIEKSAELLFEKLDEEFARFQDPGHYLLGLSGGMDSRLTLAFLSRHLEQERLELFTYGYDEKILEYVYACQVADRLGFDKPRFHQLKGESYVRALTDLPLESGGQIGIQHCHIFDFLKSFPVHAKTLISTNYSDAILGWAARYPKTDSRSSLFAVLDQTYAAGLIDQEIREAISSDINQVLKNHDPQSNISSSDEYVYITEKNQNFHMLLTFLYARYCPVSAPFVSFDLLKTALSIPLLFRQKKQLADFILKNYFDFDPEKLGNISSRFQWGGCFSKRHDLLYFKALNRVNSSLRCLTQGRVEIFNKYQTENQESVYYRNFKSTIDTALEKLASIGVLNETACAAYGKVPLRSRDFATLYQILTLSGLV